MVLPRRTRLNIEKKDFDAVESEWLARVDDSPEDISTFASVARSLVGAGETERAQMLLEILDEQIQESGDWELHLEFLRRTGDIQHSIGRLQSVILETLHHLHGDATSFDGLVQTVGLAKTCRDTKVLWDKVGRLESLLRFDESTVVYMTGKGVGVITEVNQGLESFQIDIDGKGQLRVGFRAASKVLEALPDEHVLARKVTEPDSLADAAPSEILAEILESFGRPMTAADLRDALHGFVTPQRWSTWWTAARKHPQIVASPEVRNAYVWVETTEDARGALWKSFDSASTRTKIELLRRAANEDERLRERMMRTLARLATNALSDDPSAAFEIGHGLERAGIEIEEELFSPKALVETSADPLRLLNNIDSRAPRERLYELIRELREDWHDLYARALPSESEPKLLKKLSAPLRKEAPQEWRRAVDRCLAQPVRGPGFFTWLAERAAKDEKILETVGPRMFKKVLSSIPQENFSTYRKRLLDQTDSGGSMAHLIALFDEREAADAEEALLRSVGLPRHQRDPLITTIHLKFPQLRSEEDQPIYALETSLLDKRAELRKLLEEEIPANRKAIEEAREMGDLRENFEYKSARQRHEYLSSMAAQLDGQLGRTQVLELDTVDCSEVRIGTHLDLVGDESRTLTILGPWESSPEDGIVSYESELAQSIMGRKVGDTLEIEGKTYTLGLRLIFDQQSV